MSAASRAVFLSYASQDAEAARRICDSLRATGVEVWFDQSELRGGDAWDAKIRQQIRECALFVPVVSANTQARPEGYFRLEWRLADQRTHLMGKAKSFLLPVCIDDTRDAEADVPDSFLAVQWTRLPGGETPAAFCARVRALLGNGTGVSPVSGNHGQDARATQAVKMPALPGKSGRSAIVAAGVVVVSVVATLAIWQPWRRVATAEAPAAARVAPASKSSEVARLRARLIPDAWKKEDFEPWSAAIDRIIAADDGNADAWALRSIINSLLVTRSYEAGTKPLEISRSAANRALHLAPGSAWGELALGMYHTAMISRGDDVRIAQTHLRPALAKLPRNPLTRYVELTSAFMGYDFVDAEPAAQAWLQSEPGARYPAFILGQMNLALRKPAEAAKWAAKAASDRDITGMRAFGTAFEVEYYLRGDLAAGRALLDRIPVGARVAHRVLHARWLCAMAERQWDLALQELARTPETVLFDGTYYGPTAFLAGLAHQAAGRTDAALGQFREAERVLREILTGDTQNEPLHAVLAVTLAYSGRPAEARAELALVEPLARGRSRTGYTGRVTTLLAQAHGALQEIEPTIFWLRELLSGPTNFAFTPASLRIDPRFQSVIAKPEMQALLAEFAHLDVPKAAATSATDPKSIAVLAFENRSSEKDSEYFSDGISEELLNVLAKVPGLRVVGRASSFLFKGKNEAPSKIAKELNVTHLVTGSVQRSGMRARITAELSLAATGQTLWSDKFDTELKDIFAAQDDIAGRIAAHLKLKLGYAPRIARVVNPDAYRLLLEGRYFWNLRSMEGFAQAESAITKALALDPNFAEAHAALADVYNIRATYALQDGRIERVAPEETARARAEAQRALELDPTLADAYPALAYGAFLEMRFAEAEQAFQKALALNPNNAVAHAWHGTLLLSQGKLEDGIRRYEQADLLDPLWAVNLTIHGEVLNYARRYDAALAVSDRALALRPDHVPNLGNRARILFAMGRKNEAVDAAREVRRLLEKTPRRDADGSAIWVLQQAGFAEEADGYGEAVLRTLPATSQQRGFVLGALGRFDEALPYLGRTPPVIRRRLYWDPMWDRWREDPRFTQLMKQLGCLEEYNFARRALAAISAQQPAARK